MENVIVYHKPSFYDEEWEKYLDIVSPEQLVEVKKVKGNKRFSATTPLQYHYRRHCYRRFEEGCSAYEVICETEIPPSTVYGYKEEYDLEFPVK
jgi:hypothetical protein